MFGGSDFSRVERNFTIGESYNIWGNFSKICIKINKILKSYWENLRTNAQFSKKSFDFWASHAFKNCGKNEVYNMHMQIIEGSGAEPPKVEKMWRNLSKSVM